MKEPIIELRGVSKLFHSKERSYTALKKIDMTIERGDYIAIIGKSGSGKSTLLNMITGIDHPSTGTILVNGTELTGLTENKMALWRGRNVGIVFQFFQLIPTLTIKENLLLAMEFVGKIPSPQRSGKVHELLEKVGIAQHMDKMPSSLSGGEQQRAAIARALSNDPSIIIADEPTGNLDTKTAASIHKLFKSLVTEGKTVIVVTHESDVSLRYNRIVTLADGEILSQKTEKELL